MEHLKYCSIKATRVGSQHEYEKIAALCSLLNVWILVGVHVSRISVDFVTCGEPTFEETNPALIHYTDGGPWFKEHRNCPHGDLWQKELKEMFEL